jgi:predicted RNA methylase
MNHDQFTLPFLDTTALGGGFGLYGGFPIAKSSAHAHQNFEPDEPEVLDAPVPTEPSVAAQDYWLVGNRLLADSWKSRAGDSLAAIRLMTTIESEARHARPDEQERLARFTSFGASDLADRIFRRAGDAFAPAWEDLGVELEGLVSRDDLANLKRATQYAHYTPEFMIRAIWRALRQMGFDSGRVLEPGCGTGLFFALCPEALVGKLARTGVEMDPTTARIAKLLYPNARIRHEDFTKTKLPELFDLTIGNPPFSDRTVRADDPAGELRLSLHDYFIARSVERLRPGGLAAFVTSRWTMDKVDGKARQHIATLADLIGAVRLPEGAMHDRAGTEVVVDILFLQKRDAGTAPAGVA